MYCTAADVRELLKEDIINTLIGNGYLDDDTEQDTLLAPMLERAAEDATAEIDGYLARRYPVPLTRVPKVIVKFAKDIAVYNLVSRIGVGADTDRENNYLTRYKNATKFLQAVAAGTVSLGMESPSTQAATGFQMASSSRIFSRDSMKGM
ncbi:MAG TPA: DUF1320 domain-containing protein [Clostridia bacterium]|nr:DUF1320 domain-containing protein [Clostridia bacterium]